MSRVRVKLDRPRIKYALIVQRSKFVEPEEFSETFENSTEVSKVFEHDIVFGAIVDKCAKKVYFITVNIDRTCTTLTVWEAEFEVKP